MPHTRAFWLASGFVTLLVLLFAGYFILYLTGRQDAYMTNAEDLGIMDQAIWSTVHGYLLHQTICNIIADTNCYSFSGISRFAIHFEPILFPVSLLYFIWPSPKALLALQTLVVASGAFPAFWLARLRLRSEWAAAAIALLYLLYPAQQNALVFDFHAVTFTAALLLFMLYFMYTRRTAWLFIFAMLAMACKEEIPVVVACFALWSMLFQRRWRSGLVLLLLATAWTGIGLLVVHLYSPGGHSLLASRYAYLGNDPLHIVRTVLLHPLSILKQHVLDHDHRTYLEMLFAPAGYLPLFAPWVLVLALPTLALNLLSSDPGMYSGLFQYNAELVPVLIFATIEVMVLILWLTDVLHGRGYRRSSRNNPSYSSGRACPCHDFQHPCHAFPYPCHTPPTSIPAEDANATTCHTPQHPCHDSPNHIAFLKRPSRLIRSGLLIMLLGYALISVVHEDYAHSGMPFAQDFRWPHATTHTELAQRFIDMIPPGAVVSAQTRLVPHLSQRLNVYLFPYADERAAYIFLDLAGDRYPYFSAQAYNKEVKKVLQSGDYGIVAAGNGYLLLERGLPPPGVLPYALS